MNQAEVFNQHYGKENEKVYAMGNEALKRLFSLDTNTFAKGNGKVKAIEYWKALIK